MKIKKVPSKERIWDWDEDGVLEYISSFSINIVYRKGTLSLYKINGIEFRKGNELL